MVYEKKYSWRAGKNVSAQIAGKVMEEIEERDGCVTKESFLEASRPKKSPTHKLFEWDDSVAAEKFRLHQSAMAIRDIVVTIVKSEEEQQKTPAFINVVSGLSNKAEYKSIGVAMMDEDERSAILENAFEEFKRFEDKYKSLKELSNVFEEMRKAEKKHRRTRKSTKKGDKK